MFRRVMAHVGRQPVAFVALFFALTGSAFAGTKYLAAGDGTLHGHLANSAYGYRLSANGAVTHPAHRGRPPGRPRRVRGATSSLPDVFATSMVSPVRLGEDPTTVLEETNLPAGNYLVNAKTSVVA